MLLTQPENGLSLDSKVEDVASTLYTKFTTVCGLELIQNVMEELHVEREAEIIENSELPANYGNLYN